MPTVGINLNEVVEKPKLPAGQPFTFGFVDAELGLAKKPNKNTGKQEPLIKCKRRPQEADWNERDVYHTWSLAPGALSSDDPLMSIKKYFAVVGYKWNDDGTFSTEALQLTKFIAECKYEEGNNFPRLSKIIAGVM